MPLESCTSKISSSFRACTVSVVPSCFGMMSVLMVNTLSLADSVPDKMPQDSMPRLVLATAYLHH